MSKKSKHILGGVVALLFIVSIVNTQAIISLSNKVNSALSQKVAYVADRAQTGNRVMGEYYVGNQTASIYPAGDEIFYPEPEDPDGGGGGYFVYSDNDGTLRCGYVDGEGTLHTGGTPGSGGNPNSIYDSAGCNGASLTPNGGGAHFEEMVGMDLVQIVGGAWPTLDINQQTGKITVNGTSTAAVSVKLYLLGYKDHSKMGPYYGDIRESIKAFQKANGISQTGTVGPLTTRALDAKIGMLRVGMTGGTYKIGSLLRIGDEIIDPDNGGGGYFMYVVNGETLCGYVNVFGQLQTGGTVTDGGANSGNAYSGSGCSGSGSIIFSGDGGLPTLDINPQTGRITVGGTSTAVVSLKLALLGYGLDQAKMGPYYDIQNTLKEFQKANGISQTGTVGPLTTRALDAKIGALKATMIGGEYKLYSY